MAPSNTTHEVSVSLLTGGGDRPYALGLANELIAKRVSLDLIGSNDLECEEFHGNPRVNFLNLRGDQRSDASIGRKVYRVLAYYAKLIRYAATSKPKIFHILWNNKFDLLDRVILMLYYKALGKKIALTVHNVNIRKRDSNDTPLNRFTLRTQYQLADHIFVHTERMKMDLVEEFGVRRAAITVIPFGINNAVPNTSLSSGEARRRLGIPEDKKAILFFGNIAPYKGLEYLVRSFHNHLGGRDDYRLIIAGKPKNCEEYWKGIQEAIGNGIQKGQVLLKCDYIADEEIEIYFKAADVLVLPYRHIYQSGVLFLGYSFGLPALAADVGSLKEEIIEGTTGLTFRPEDPADLARAIETYFASELYQDLATRRQGIIDYARERYSWDTVGRITTGVYAKLSTKP